MPVPPERSNVEKSIINHICRGGVPKDGERRWAKGGEVNVFDAQSRVRRGRRGLTCMMGLPGIAGATNRFFGPQCVDLA